MTKTRTFVVTATPEMMIKIERMLAWMHWNSRWGHSGKVCTSMDGDGPERVTVKGLDLNAHRPFVTDLPREKTFIEWVGSELAHAPN